MPTPVMTSDNPDPGYIVLRGEHLPYSTMAATIKEARNLFNLKLVDARDLIRECFGGTTDLVPWADATIRGEKFLRKVDARDAFSALALGGLMSGELTVADLHRVIERYMDATWE